jgi:hypothetical protein
VKSRSVILAAAVVLSACRSDRITDPVIIPPLPVVPLKDLVIPGLPEPYYHFAYDSLGRVSNVSFAGQLTDYVVTYSGGRLEELKNNVFANNDRSVYEYDSQGRVSAVTFLDATAAVVGHYFLTYSGNQLVKLERDRVAPGVGLVINKVMTFTYYPDSNLKLMVDHRPAVAGQGDSTTVTHLFEDYDGKTNVDAFDLLHGDFFDNLVLLPTVLLQKSNPLKETVTTSTQVRVTTNAFTFDSEQRPQVRTSELTVVSGPGVGSKATSQTFYSYY